MENTQIKLKNKKSGKEYILEYNRKTVQQIERLGFSINQASEKPMTMFPLMFRGAFLANHKYLKEKEIEEIYDGLKNKNELNEKLLTMITECYSTLLDGDEEENEGNVDWEIV